MNIRCMKTMKRIAGVLALSCALSTGSALAYTTPSESGSASDAMMASLPYGYLSASAETVVDSANATEDMQAAQNQVEEEERQAREAAAAAAAAAATAARINQLVNGSVTPHSISKSSSLAADSVIKNNFKKLGNYRLSFYCPCATCNGRSDGKTRLGTTMAEGRTIAVDSRVIPLGSRVYIDGYGVFIAEDTGGAIKGNRIDVCVANHSRAYQFGIDYADVYLIG